MSGLTSAHDGEWWKTGTLKPEVHSQIIADRLAIARRSGLGEVHMSAIWEPLPDSIRDAERNWMRKLIQTKKAPHMRYGGRASAVRAQFVAMAGALIRNFVDARILSIDDIAEMQIEDNFVKAGALFLPDFLIPGETEAKHDRIRQNVLTCLRRRLLSGEPIIVYAGQTNAKPWGAAFHEELKSFADAGEL